MTDFVPEEAIDYEEVLRRGGRNFGDEDFALFKCPTCRQVYLLEYEVDTVYLDANDLANRVSVFGESFECTGCRQRVPDSDPWAGPRASARFLVTWDELANSPWSWIARR